MDVILSWRTNALGSSSRACGPCFLLATKPHWQFLLRHTHEHTLELLFYKFVSIPPILTATRKLYLRSAIFWDSISCHGSET